MHYLSLTLFSLLFFLAPPTDLFRYDLPAGHFVLFGEPWMPHLSDTARIKASHDGSDRQGKSGGVLFVDDNGNGRHDLGERTLAGVVAELTDAAGRTHRVTTDRQGHYLADISARQRSLDAYLITDANARYILLRLLLPTIAVALLLVWAARRWGRIYCGWLCPHHWVVELVNGLVRRSCGKRSLWDRAPLPRQQCDGTRVIPDPRYWLPTALVILLLALTWTLGFLSYLLTNARSAQITGFRVLNSLPRQR